MNEIDRLKFDVGAMNEIMYEANINKRELEKENEALKAEKPIVGLQLKWTGSNKLNISFIPEDK